MSDLTKAIEKHLGRHVEANALSYYSLLGVEEDSTPEQIKQGLRRAANAWNASDTKSEPEVAQRVAKLIKEAQAILLDPQRRREYDVERAKQARIPEPVDAMAEYFPAEDPLSAFNSETCLVGAEADSKAMSFGSVESRWNELRNQIPTLDYVAASSLVEQNPIYQEVETTRPTAESPESALSRIEQIQRKRRGQQAMYVLGFIALASAFLIYAGVRFALNQIALNDQTEKNRQVEQTNESVAAVEPKEHSPKQNLPGISNGKTDKAVKPAQRSGLPKISQGDEGVEGENKMAMMPGESSADATMNMSDSNMSTEPMTPMVTPPSNAMEAAVPKPEDGKPESMNSSMTNATTEPATPIPPQPQPPMASNPAWTEAMKTAKQAVEKGDFDTFQKQMEIALPLSTTNEMEAKFKRLDQLGQLHQIFIKSLKDAKGKLKVAAGIRVGKNQVSVVEIKPKEIILRVGGKNETYEWERLPIGIALALSDLTLDENDPTDVAARAVYCSLSPTRNDLTAKKVQALFEKSLGKGSIRQDLPQALTDTYE